MQLAFDATDRLVEALEERRAPLSAVEAARVLFASRAIPEALACTLVRETVVEDARLAWLDSAVGLAGPASDPLLEEAEFVVFDLETTGLSAATSRICEIGAVRVRSLELQDCFETLVDPGMPLPAPIAALTGIAERDLRGAPRVGSAVRRFLAFTGAGVLVAHNARFDLAFLDRQLDLIYGRKRATVALDTVALARRLLEGRAARASLASLSHFFGTSAQPCHRALPDAQATAEILLQLIGLAQERGARTLSDLHALAAPRQRRVYGKRGLAHGAPPRPGVYLWRDRHGQVLYVGRARDLRARLRSYFRSERQRPAVEAALGAVERIEWKVLGSELEAALEELRLIQELRPPANARNARPDRYVYLKRRGDEFVVSSTPTPLGPLRSRRKAQLAARALSGATEEEIAALPDGEAPLRRLRARLRDLAGSLRYEDAARLRDRIAALEDTLRQLRKLETLRARELCLVVPGIEAGSLRAFFLSGGRLSTRLLDGNQLAEVAEGIAAAPQAPPASVDELLTLATFVRRPPPELTILPLDVEAVCRRLPHLAAVAAAAA